MHQLNRRMVALGVGLAALSVLAPEASALQWPQRTVRVIVPLPPGSAIDVSARLIAEQLARRWQQPVVIENIAGADGIPAAREFVGRRDDHTLMYSFAGLITINPLLKSCLTIRNAISCRSQPPRTTSWP
jgi:tripartite-type tricarboxylate transporter receptor subunit TctC